MLISHLDGSKGRDQGLSLRPVADRLGRLTGAAVAVAPEGVGPQVREMIERLAPGQMLML